MSTKVQLNEGQSYVEGRSEETARDLIERATALGLQHEVYTTSFGYVVPSAVLESAGEADAEEGDADAEAGDTEDSDPAAGEDSAEEKAEQFDPSEATIAEIEDYLDNADEAERARVFAAEEAGKNRKGVLALAEAPEGAK